MRCWKCHQREAATETELICQVCGEPADHNLSAETGVFAVPPQEDDGITYLCCACLDARVERRKSE